MNYRLISIGALSTHELWTKQGSPRTAHATTVLIESEGKHILVDPGLPEQALVPRLAERSGLTPDDIDLVFLTCFRPAHRLGIGAFKKAKWLISEAEREQVGVHLIGKLKEIQTSDDAISASESDLADAERLIQQDIAILQKCQAADDSLAANVDLFPSPGYTPGTCGLLLTDPNTTTLIAGDAIPTTEHLEQGRILRGAYDIKQAQESFLEAVEIADVIIPSHDDTQLNRTRRGY